MGKWSALHTTSTVLFFFIVETKRGRKISSAAGCKFTLKATAAAYMLMVMGFCVAHCGGILHCKTFIIFYIFYLVSLILKKSLTCVFIFLSLPFAIISHILISCKFGSLPHDFSLYWRSTKQATFKQSGMLAVSHNVSLKFTHMRNWFHEKRQDESAKNTKGRLECMVHE